MEIDILTKEDLAKFKAELIQEFKQLLGVNAVDPKQWLKSREVKKLLKISSGTLQTLRLNGTLPYEKIGGILYYDYAEIQKLLGKRGGRMD
ncbi:MAG TPA: helix-turn-helix domain-containing protein [Pedobacter sp.]|nr:helix-turn-helix domain-containing protein [Pedobacter sp.]